MLQDYWSLVAGQMYAEVPLAGSKGPAMWSSNSTTRRLDAVRFDTADSPPRLLSFFNYRNEFLSCLNRELPWLIEVKRKINRTVIGQILVGADLFEEQYKVQPQKLVILCRTGDDALEWFCRKQGIEVVFARAKHKTQAS